MKWWPVFVALTIVSWGSYVQAIHAGQMALGKGSIRAFLCVGNAYFMTAVLVPLVLLLVFRVEPWEFNTKGVSISTFAGILGAIGALGIILALKTGGNPLYVAPLVFAGAPLVNVLIGMLLHRPQHPPHPIFYTAILGMAVCGYLVLRFKPT